LFGSFRFVVATHAAELGMMRGVSSVLRMNGFEVLRFRFLGRSAHAGAHPHLGKNAQNSGSLFLQACAFLREEFPENQHIRIHPVLRSRPDQAVNFIPDLATVETYVRAVEEATVQEVTDKLCRAARGCAQAIGNSVDIERIQGYAPFAVDKDLHILLRSVAASTGVEFVEEEFSAASTDMGDISQIKPAIIVGLPGSNGRFHSPEFQVTDEQAAYVFPAEILEAYLTRLVEQT
jgi:metal-dependent amidase/aminoacylase/carboxypeptidase family protein